MYLHWGPSPALAHHTKHILFQSRIFTFGAIYSSVAGMIQYRYMHLGKMLSSLVCHHVSQNSHKDGSKNTETTVCLLNSDDPLFTDRLETALRVRQSMVLGETWQFTMPASPATS